MSDIPINRIGLSLPCMVPILPGDPFTEAPIEQRTECCNVDGWWFVGNAIMCDQHLRLVAGDGPIDDLAREYMEDGWPQIPNETERKPWAEMHRYEQRFDVLPEGHPLYRAAAAVSQTDSRDA